jgi:hypothetical protein
VAQSGGANKPIEAKLDEMYLPLRLSTGFDPSDVDKGSVYSPLALLSRDKPVVIRGIAGSGKTTWMRWTFRALLKDKDTFPMIVELRRLASSWMQGSTGGEQRSLDNYLQGWVSEYVSANWVSKLQGILTAESGPRPVLFVDGWDELGPLGEELRSKLVGFVATHPRVLVVVTSRPYGQGRPSHSDGFDVLDIQPLSDPEIKAFAENFYRECYGEDERTAEEYVTRFLTALDRSPEATSLARTALLLTMMLLISRSSPLPDKRHLLYQKCVENLLTALPDRRQEEGALLTSEQWRPDDSEERLRTVARMAFRMQDYGYQDSKRRAIILGWDDARTQLPESWREDQKDKFIRWLTGPAGLIVDRADGTIAFAHLSFQEFLAAWYLHTTIEGDEARKEFCAARLNDVSWWETLRLWAALVAGQHPAKWLPVIERLLSEEVGLYLAGAMIADGLSSDDLLVQWIASFLEIVRRAWSYHMDATIQAWAASRQEDRKRIIAEKLNSVAPGTWLEWMRYREWAGAVRLQVTLPLPAEGSNDRAVIDGLYRKIETPEQIALGRILCSGSPLWPGEPSELVLLQVWPSRRRVIGHLLQSLVSLGATRTQLLRVAKHSFARVQQAYPYYEAEEEGAPRISDFLYTFGGTWAVNVGSYELFEFDHSTWGRIGRLIG